MSLNLVSLQFRNADPAVSLALPLRPNPDKPPFGVPEWPSGQDVFVAWRLDRTKAGGVSVQAVFGSDVSSQFQIKADDPTGMNLSGSIPPFTVEIQANTQVVVTAQLNAPFLKDAAQARVTLRTDTWQWCWRAGANDPWTPLIATSHRSYAVLSGPSVPWSDTQSENYVWTDALEFSCKWAEGATTADEAATRIVRAFFDLGSGAARRFFYGGCASYTHSPSVNPYFGCVDLIRYLNTGRPALPMIDCHDIASAVSTFGNALGAALIQGRVCRPDAVFFRTNPAVTLGGKPAPPQFSQHEMAWGGQALDSDPVWDACLQVDADDNPGKPPHDFQLVAGAVYTANGGHGYRDRLAIHADAKRLSAPGPLSPADNRVLRSAYPPPRFTPWVVPSISVDVDRLHQFLGTVTLDPWKMFEWYREVTPSGDTIFRSELLTPSGTRGPVAAVEWISCPSVQRARDVFREYRLFFSAPTAPIEELGDGAFGLVGGDCVVFLRWNVVVRVARGSFEPGPLPVLPKTIDRAFVATFTGTLI